MILIDKNTFDKLSEKTQKELKSFNLTQFDRFAMSSTNYINDYNILSSFRCYPMSTYQQSCISHTNLGLELIKLINFAKKDEEIDELRKKLAEQEKTLAAIKKIKEFIKE